jgi:hypothetical protein
MAKNHRTFRWAHEQRSSSLMVECHATTMGSERQKVRGILRCQVAPDCPVCHRTIRCTTRIGEFNGQLLQTPTIGWRGTHRTMNSGVSGAYRTVQCAHRQRIHPTTRMLVGAINTSQPPPFKASKLSTLYTQYKSKEDTPKTHSKPSILSKCHNQVKWSKVFSDLREGDLCFNCCSCCLVAFCISL